MDNTHENIELYLLDKLDRDQMLEFEKAMQADPLLKTEVEQMRGILTAFEQCGEKRSFDSMQRLGSEEELIKIIKQAENKQSDKLSRSRLYIWSTSIAVAATLLLFIGLQHENTPQMLFNTYFSNEQHFEVTPSRGDSDNISEEQTMYDALSLIKANRTQEAIEALTPIANNNNSELQNDAQWNLALVWLKEGNRDQATNMLDKLINSNGKFSKEATELKYKIEKRRWF